MTTVCHACTADVTDMPVRCKGFCKAEFHLKCSKIPADIAEELIKNKQIFWMCQSCTKLMDDVRVRSSIRAAYETGQNKILSEHTEIVQNLKMEIMFELKNEIRSNFTALINSSSHTPKSGTHPAYAERFLGRRKLFQKQTANPQQELMCGTGNSLSPSTDNFTVPAPSQKFWIYLSRISRDVTADQVRELARQRLGTDDVEAVRLVANGRDISTLSFISFKIGINPELKAKALSTSTWPKGMLFREFRDNKAAANFWKPNRTPNAEASPSNLSSSHSNHQSYAMTE